MLIAQVNAAGQGGERDSAGTIYKLFRLAEDKRELPCPAAFT